jgi:hypothetical protein
MAKAQITFSQMIQDSQDYGSTDEHMVSRVFFDLAVQGKVYSGLFANVKQTVGSSFENAPLEVSRPIGYDGPFNYHAFQNAVEQYYRSNIGASGRGIGIAGDVSNLRMRNNRFVRPHQVEIEIEAENKSW